MAATRGQKPPKIVPFRSDARRLEAIVRTLAADTSKVSFLRHALERMAQRGIDDVDVYRCLRRGFVLAETIRPGDGPRETVCKVVEQNKGARDLGVITIVVGEIELLVKTVEWEDFK